MGKLTVYHNLSLVAQDVPQTFHNKRFVPSNHGHGPDPDHGRDHGPDPYNFLGSRGLDTSCKNKICHTAFLNIKSIFSTG